MVKVEIRRTKKGDYYFRIVASNGRILCHSEGYQSKQSVYNGVDALKGVAEVKESAYKEVR